MLFSEYLLTKESSVYKNHLICKNTKYIYFIYMILNIKYIGKIYIACIEII